MPGKFRVTIHGECRLAIRDVWPRDASLNEQPEHPTAADVIAIMREERTVMLLIEQWMLDDCLSVTVDDGTTTATWTMRRGSGT